MNTTAILRTMTRSGWRGAAFAMALGAALLASVPALHAQGSRKDDIVFGPEGRPVSGATVRVCQPTATGTPCTPLATIYTDATLMTAAANPLQTDGIGNYHFYAPAGRYEIQISSPQISGTITQPDVILPADVSSSFSPSSLNVMGNSTVAGPRPYIDVTSPLYGAIGDGGAEQATGTIGAGSNHMTITPGIGTWKVGMGLHVLGAGASSDTLFATITAISGNNFTLSANASTSVTNANIQDDDTPAIRAAISAYCTSPGNANGGSIYFPPGNYIFAQPQTSNANGVPFTACTGIHFIGGNSGSHNGTAFVRPPSVSLLGNCGSSPNAQPAFLAVYPTNNVTFENLVITGCNQAVGANSQVLAFKNVALTVPTTGLPDNAALHLYNTFWVWFEGGALNTSSANVPTLLLTGDNCGGSCFDGVGDLYVRDALLSGGQIQYIQRANITGSPSGHWVFRNITQESGNTDLISITDPGAYPTGTIGPITLDDVQQADIGNASAALINFNVSGGGLSGLYINNSFSGAGKLSAPAVKMTAGSLDHYFITGCDGPCVNQVWNASGNPAGNGMTESTGGFDFTSDVTNAERLITAPLSNANQDGTGPGARFIQSGSQFASYGIDAANGWMFGSNTQAGWNAQISQSTAPNIDIAFAANYPPTNVSATVSPSGGTIGPGTYWVWVVSTTASSCGSNSTMSAGSNIYGPITISSGTTNSFVVTWTPSVAGAVPIQGYCVFGNGQAPVYSKFSPCSNLVAGAGATGATVGTFPSSPGAFPITYQMVQEHHITPAGAIFNGNSTPAAAAGSPYQPACLAAITCSAFLSLSPITADSFARPNASTLGANWSNTVSGPGLANMVISGNSATSSGTNAGLQSWIGQTFLADQFSKATINTYTGGASDIDGVLVRGTGTNVDTSYDFWCTNGASLIQKRVAGTVTNLATGGPNCAAGNIIELDVEGTSTAYLTALINGAVVLTYADSSSPIASGSPGIVTWASSDSLTNFVGGNLAAGNASQSILTQPNTWVGPQNYVTSTNFAAGAIFNGDATPLASAGAPYQPACLAAVTCSGFVPLSPIVADSFTRANSSTLGANWSSTVSGGGFVSMSISGNAAAGTGSAAGLQSWIGQTFLADQFAKLTINTYTDGASDLIGVMVRGTGTSTDTSYAMWCTNGGSFIQKRVAGTATSLVTGGPNCAAGNTIELDVVGANPAYLTALINGAAVLTYADSSSPIASGRPGMLIWTSGDSAKNFVAGSLPVGNASQSILSQPNTWTAPQTFASPITSASLATPNKTRTCNIVRGDQSGSALTTGNIQPQGSLCYIDAASTVAQVIVMTDAGASTMQLGYRHNGSTTAISPTLTPAAVSGITDHVACANSGGSAITIEGNSVTCSALTNASLTAGDFIETIGGSADGTSKRMSIAMTFTPN